MAAKVKDKAQELRDAQVKLDAGLAELKAQIAMEVAPLRAEREKINLQIAELQVRQKELSEKIAGIEAFGQPVRAPGAMGFSITKPDGTKQKVG